MNTSRYSFLPRPSRLLHPHTHIPISLFPRFCLEKKKKKQLQDKIWEEAWEQGYIPIPLEMAKT